MPEKMSFASVIRSQGVPFVAHIQSDGDYVDGEWKKVKKSRLT